MTGHDWRPLEVRTVDGRTEFRAACSCPWRGPWKSTNAAGGSWRRHVAALRAAARKALE